MPTAQAALGLLKTVVGEVASLPGGTVGELLNGNMVLRQEGTWIISAATAYEYAVRGALDHPSSSMLRVTLAVQASRGTLEAIDADDPISAFVKISEDIREKLESESAALRFLNDLPGASVEVWFESAEPFFVEGENIGAMQVNLVLQGYDNG